MDEEKKKTEDEITLKPKMTLLNGITVIVGSIIGSGIFVSPAGVLMHTGSVNASLVVWVVSGIFSMVSLNAYFFFNFEIFNQCGMKSPSGLLRQLILYLANSRDDLPLNILRQPTILYLSLSSSSILNASLSICQWGMLSPLKLNMWKLTRQGGIYLANICNSHH